MYRVNIILMSFESPHNLSLFEIESVNVIISAASEHQLLLLTPPEGVDVDPVYDGSPTRERYLPRGFGSFVLQTAPVPTADLTVGSHHEELLRRSHGTNLDILVHGEGLLRLVAVREVIEVGIQDLVKTVRIKQL